MSIPNALDRRYNYYLLLLPIPCLTITYTLYYYSSCVDFSHFFFLLLFTCLSLLVLTKLLFHCLSRSFKYLSFYSLIFSLFTTNLLSINYLLLLFFLVGFLLSCSISSSSFLSKTISYSQLVYCKSSFFYYLLDFFLVNVPFYECINFWCNSFICYYYWFFNMIIIFSFHRSHQLLIVQLQLLTNDNVIRS